MISFFVLSENMFQISIVNFINSKDYYLSDNKTERGFGVNS